MTVVEAVLGEGNFEADGMELGGVSSISGLKDGVEG